VGCLFAGVVPVPVYPPVRSPLMIQKHVIYTLP
jgi:hypothetical protein